MGKLFGGGSKSTPVPEPTPPAPMPDPEDPLAKRQRRQTTAGTRTTRNSSAASDRLSTVPGTIGREFQRSTLGAS